MSLLLLCFALLLPTADAAHDYHVSKSRIHYDADARAYQITLHLFIDDLEAALRLRGIDGLYLGTERETAEADTYVATYLQDRFNLRADSTTLGYTYLGKEVSEDLMAFYIYLEVANVALDPSLDVTNALLTEVHDDQRNIVQIQVGKAIRGYFICTREDPSERVVLR